MAQQEKLDCRSNCSEVLLPGLDLNQSLESSSLEDLQLADDVLAVELVDLDLFE